MESGLRETVIKRCIAERISKADIRPEGREESGELSGEFME